MEMVMKMRMRTVSNRVETKVPVLRGKLSMRVLNHYSLAGLKAPEMGNLYVKIGRGLREKLNLGDEKYQSLSAVLPKAQLCQENFIKKPLYKDTKAWSCISAFLGVTTGLAGYALAMHDWQSHIMGKITAVACIVFGIVATTASVFEAVSYESANNFYNHLVELNQKPVDPAQ
jgi:hypothetical protein